MNFLNVFKPNFLAKVDIKLVFGFLTLWVVAFMVYAQFATSEVMPKPTDVLNALIKIVQDDRFADNIFATLGLVCKGMAISVGIAVLLSYMSLVPALNGVTLLVSKLRFLTYIGLVFVFTMAIKNEHDIKMSLLIFGIVPFFVTTFISYINDIPRKEYELCYTLKFNNWRTLYEVVIKGRLHTLLEVIKQNFAIGWMMITGVEGLCMSEGGIGTLMIKSNKHLAMAEVFAILAIVFVFGMIFDYLFDVLKVFFFPYTDPNRFRKLWINIFIGYFWNKKPKTEEVIVTEPAVSHTSEPQKTTTSLFSTFTNVFKK